MKNILLLIFTIADDDINTGYFNQIYGEKELTKRNWEKLYLSFKIDGGKYDKAFISDSPDIIFINDLQSYDAETIINNSAANDVYVILHTTSNRQLKMSAINSVKKIICINDHHNEGGWHFNYLCRLSHVFNSDEEKYKQIIRELISKFPNPLEEAKKQFWKILDLVSVKIYRGIIKDETLFKEEMKIIKENKEIEKYIMNIEIENKSEEKITIKDLLSDDHTQRFTKDNFLKKLQELKLYTQLFAKQES